MRTHRIAVAMALVLTGACASDTDDRRDGAAETGPPASPDLTARRVPVAPAAAPPTLAPPPSAPSAVEPFRPPRPRGRVLELTLRSTPPGAAAAVDGRVIGTTPTYWRGPTTGTPREFTFVLSDYAMARYRFVPTTNGVVHATLKPLIRDADTDAGPPP